MSRISIALLIPTILPLLSGCSTTVTPAALAKDRASLISESLVQPPRPSPHLELITDRPYVDTTPVPYRGAGPKDVQLTVRRTPVGNVVQGLAQQLGYSVFFAGRAEAETPVDLSVRGSTGIEAIKLAAQAAGYIALVQPDKRQVLISDRGTYMFRIPQDVFKKNEAKYKVGGNPSSLGSSGGGSGGSGGGGAGSGGGGAGSAMSAEFSITGQAGGDTQKEFVENIKEMAGKDATVSMNWTTGLLSVSADAPSLLRINAFISSLTKTAMTQVEIQAAIAQVTLSNQQQFGVDWSQVVPVSGNADVKLGLANGAMLAGTQALSATLTTASIASVLKALESQSRVSVLAQPRLVAQNFTPANLFNGKQSPFLGEIQSSVTGSSGTSSSGASLSYVLDGVSLSFVPTVIDNDLVSMKLIPVLSSVGQFKTFTTQGGQLQGPEQYIRQGFMNVLAHNNQTLILGGARSATRAERGQSLPGAMDIPLFGKLLSGIDNGNSRDELVILLSVRILPAPQFNPLVSEQL